MEELGRITILHLRDSLVGEDGGEVKLLISVGSVGRISVEFFSWLELAF